MNPFDVAGLLNTADMPSHLKKIERALENATATDNSALHRPIDRLIHANSKRLRSVLVIGVAASQGKVVDGSIITGCAAIELIHIASLVHDDIIDHAQTRWGVPTVSRQEGVDDAILVGDYLFAKANVLAAGISREAAELVAGTITALIDGESREVADEFNLDRSIGSYFSSIKGKTAALVVAACQMGGLCAGLDKRKLSALAQYGEAFGLSFQLIDDVLDFVSNEKLMGKPTGNDVKEGVYTLPVILALQGKDTAQIRQLLAQKDTQKLSERLTARGYIEQTLREARKYNHRAEAALKDISGTAELAQLPGTYMQWALDNLVDLSVAKTTF